LLGTSILEQRDRAVPLFRSPGTPAHVAPDSLKLEAPNASGLFGWEASILSSLRRGFRRVRWHRSMARCSDWPAWRAGHAGRHRRWTPFL